MRKKRTFTFFSLPLRLLGYFTFVFILLQTSFLLANYDEVFSKESSFKTITADNNGLYSNDISGPKRLTLPSYDSSYLEDFQIEFFFKSESPKDQMNLFQTSNEGSGIRLEINLIGNTLANLTIQYRTYDNKERAIKLTDQFAISQTNKLGLRLDRNNNLSIHLNERKIFSRTLLDQGIVYSQVIIGSGLSGTRNFVGDMWDVKLDYKVYERHPLPFHTIFWPLVIIFSAFEFWIYKKDQRRKILVKEGIRSLSAVSLIFFITFFLHSRKKSTEFFGDDFLSIFFYMGNTPISMFREPIGPYFRPVSGFLIFFRYLFHDLNLNEWLFWNYVLVSVFASCTYFVTLKLLRSRLTSLLFGLVVATSPALYANMTWWASVGAHQLNTLYLFLLTLYVVSRVHLASRKNIQIGLFLLILLLSFSSEMYLGLLILPTIFVITGNLFSRRLNRRMKFINRGKTGKSKSDVLGRGTIQSFTDIQVYIVNAILILVVGIIRYVWKDLPIAVASSSAVDYRYNSFSIYEIVQNLIAYSSALMNIYLFPFNDIGYGLNPLTTGFLTLEFFIQCLLVISAAIIIGVLVHALLNKLSGLRRINSVSTDDVERIGSLNRYTNLFILGLTTAVPGLLVPGYLQLRYMTPLYLTVLLLIFMFLSKRASTLVAALLIITNLLALNANYGILNGVF